MSNGTFSGNPKTEWLTEDGADRNMKLLEDFGFTDSKGKEWMAQQGSTINGASIPRALWSIVGSPYTDDYRRASIVHDVACNTSNANRKEADVMFYEACIAGGCSPAQAKMLYAGVRIGAWASTILPLGAFSKENTLFRVPLEVNSNTQIIQGKFQDIVMEFCELPDDALPNELDKIIEKHIRLN